MSKRILIVDDDEDIRNLMAHFLKETEAECVFAEDAIKGLEILRDQDSFDLLISDVMMPQMNGMEFIQHVNGFYPNLPIAVCSSGGASQSNGLSASELMELALERGAKKSLSKPFSKSDLIDLVFKISESAA